jgi:hypothetical protein
VSVTKVIYITGLVGKNMDAEMFALKCLESSCGEPDAYVVCDTREHAPPPMHLESRGVPIHIRGKLEKGEKLAGLLVCWRWDDGEKRLVERAERLGAAVVAVWP